MSAGLACRGIRWRSNAGYILAGGRSEFGGCKNRKGRASVGEGSPTRCWLLEQETNSFHGLLCEGHGIQHFSVGYG